jgi:hypothetical protein
MVLNPSTPVVSLSEYSYNTLILFVCFIQFVRMLLKLCACVLYMNIVYVRLYGFSMNVNLNKSYLRYILP